MKLNLAGLGTEVTKLMIKKSPEILAGMGIGCFIFATVKAVEKTPEAMKQIEKDGAKTTSEKIRSGWRYYVIPGVGIIFGTICVGASVFVSNKRCVHLATACIGYEQLLAKQYEKTEEIVGKKKADEIRDAVALDNLEPYQAKPLSEEGVIHTGHGNVLFYETITGRFFRSSIERVNSCEIALARKVINEMRVTASEWFDLLDLPRTDISDGCLWDVDCGVPEIKRTCGKLPTMSSSGGTEPCFVLTVIPGPATKYHNMYF